MSRSLEYVELGCRVPMSRNQKMGRAQDRPKVSLSQGTRASAK